MKMYIFLFEIRSIVIKEIRFWNNLPIGDDELRI